MVFGKGQAKNGATYVEPAPVRVPAELTPVPVAAAGVAETGVEVVVLVHAARARAPIAAAATLMVLIKVWRDVGPCLSSLAGIGFPLRLGRA